MTTAQEARTIAEYYADGNVASAMGQYARTGKMSRALLDEIQGDINWFKSNTTSHNELTILYCYIQAETLKTQGDA